MWFFPTQDPLIPSAKQLVGNAMASGDPGALSFLNEAGLLSDKLQLHAFDLVLEKSWNPAMFDRLMALRGGPPDWEGIFTRLKATTSPECIRHFITLGLVPDLVFKTGRTPLLYAIFGGANEAARALLALGADPNRRDAYGRTPLMQTLLLSEPAPQLRLLCDSGADPNAVDSGGLSVLAHAVLRNPSAIRTLLQLGADPKAACGDCRDAARFAARELHPYAFAELQKRLGRGRLLHDRSWIQDKPTRRIIFSHYRVFPDDEALEAALRSAPDPRRLIRTLLLRTNARLKITWAKELGHPEDADFRLDGRYSYVVHSSNANLPPEARADALRFLHYCAFKSAAALDALLHQMPVFPGERLDWLDYSGAPVRFNACFSRGKPAESYGGGTQAPRVSLLNLGLHVAVRYGNSAALPWLKERGADFGSHYRDGQGLVDGAPDFATLRTLISLGAPLNSNPAFAYHAFPTALGNAVERDDATSIRLLLDRGSNPNDQSEILGIRHENALYHSVRLGHPEAFFALLEKVASLSPNFRPKSGESLMELACTTPHTRILSWLLSAGGSLESPDKFGHPVWFHLFDYSQNRSVRDACARMLRIFRELLRLGHLRREQLADPFGRRFAAISKQSRSLGSPYAFAFLAMWHFAPSRRKKARLLRYALFAEPAYLSEVGFDSWLETHRSQLIPLLLRKHLPGHLASLLRNWELNETDWKKLAANSAIFPDYAKALLANPGLPDDLRTLLEISCHTESRTDLEW